METDSQCFLEIPLLYQGVIYQEEAQLSVILSAVYLFPATFSF